MSLQGSEVKSLREGKAQIAESYARFDDTELWLYQMHVPPWVYATGFGSHDPDRRRKLLAHRHDEITTCVAGVGPTAEITGFEPWVVYHNCGRRRCRREDRS